MDCHSLCVGSAPSQAQELAGLFHIDDKRIKQAVSNAYLVAEAYFHDYACFRAIYADETPVGFVMISDEPDKPE